MRRVSRFSITQSSRAALAKQTTRILCPSVIVWLCVCGLLGIESVNHSGHKNIFTKNYLETVSHFSSKIIKKKNHPWELLLFIAIIHCKFNIVLDFPEQNVKMCWLATNKTKIIISMSSLSLLISIIKFKPQVEISMLCLGNYCPHSFMHVWANEHTPTGLEYFINQCVLFSSCCMFLISPTRLHLLDWIGLLTFSSFLVY